MWLCAVWPCSVSSKWSSVAVIPNLLPNMLWPSEPWDAGSLGLASWVGQRTSRHKGSTFFWALSKLPFFPIYILAWPLGRESSGRSGTPLCVGQPCQQPASVCLWGGQRWSICWCRYPDCVLCSAQPSWSQTGARHKPILSAAMAGEWYGGGGHGESQFRALWMSPGQPCTKVQEKQSCCSQPCRCQEHEEGHGAPQGGDKKKQAGTKGLARCRKP